MRHTNKIKNGLYLGIATDALALAAAGAGATGALTLAAPLAAAGAAAGALAGLAGAVLVGKSNTPAPFEEPR